MPTFDQTPTFNLKAVIQETGLKPDTLRAWERRYGLPNPERTPGGHRLYSQHDIEMLKWLITRQEEGLSISRAIDLWRKIEAEGQDPLQAPGYTVTETPVTPVFTPVGNSITELRQAWLSTCLAFDEQGAEQVLTQAFALYPPENVCFEILLKGLSEIGTGWYSGDITIQQEHFASELATRRLETLVAAAPPPTHPGRILVGCAPEDAHAFVPLLITFLLKRHGWDVVNLGARVPAARLETTIASIRPNLTILSAQQLVAAATLLEVTDLLQQANVPLAFGGTIFNRVPALRDRIPGYFLGERLEEVPQKVAHLMNSPAPPPSVKPVSKAYRQALAHYRERRTLIEADVWQHNESLDIAPTHLSLANEALARNIRAALTLGDLDLIATDITWIEGLLTSYHIASESLYRYFQAYHQAAKNHLDERGEVIVNWLAQQKAKNTNRNM